MKTYKKLETINEKIEAAKQQDKSLKISYNAYDSSVQAEQRLSIDMQIRISIDDIHAPKQLRQGDRLAPWVENSKINFEIVYNIAKLYENTIQCENKINEKTKTGPALRAEAKEKFAIETGNMFLSEYEKAKKQLPGLLKKIKESQAKQKEIIKQMRAENSAYLAECKNKKTAQASADQAALTSGEFWNASETAIKAYFHPPFDKNYLADVSEEWRAALFVECKSESYKNYSGNWRHKLVGTGRGWLCGIDDNGDEWGHRVGNLNQRMSEYGSIELDADIEDAMAELFDMSIEAVKKSYRQGDLMFCPAEIKPATTLHPQEKWHIRESHTIWSPGLMRNGQYFSSNKEIEISHTSHAPVYLPAGEYRLYEIQIPDAD